MQSIFESASKIVFILLALTFCIGFLLKLLDPSDFMMIVGMVFTFYFSYKGTPAVTTTVESGKTVEITPPFAGK